MTLSVDAGRTVTVDYATSDGTAMAGADYTQTAGTLTFAAGETTKTVSVPVLDDDIDEEDETFTLTLNNAVNAGFGGGESLLTVTGTIEDDDERGLLLSSTAIEVQEGGRNTYTIVLKSQPTAAMAVTVRVPAGADLSVDTRKLTFTPENWDDPQTVTVNAYQDRDAQPDPKVVVEHSASGGDYGGAQRSPGSGSVSASLDVTIIEDDEPTVRLSLDSSTISEDGGVATVTAALSEQSTAETTITVSTNPADTTTLSANTTLTIAAGQTTSTGVVTVTAKDDAAYTGDREVVVKGAASNTVGVDDPDDATLTITDDDPDTPTNTPVPSATPTLTPTPTSTPTITPTPLPSATPANTPTLTPTPFVPQVNYGSPTPTPTATTSPKPADGGDLPTKNAPPDDPRDDNWSDDDSSSTRRSCPPMVLRLPRIIGQTAGATAYELPHDRVLLHLHASAAASVVLRVGWIAADGATLVPAGFVRDDERGQTYAVVRREADGLIVRRWVAPDDPLRYAVPWDHVNSEHTLPVTVLATIPLDERHPPPNQLARRFDGLDDRIFAYDASLGQWWHVPDLATFQALAGLFWDDVTAADAAFFTRIITGAAVRRPLPPPPLATGLGADEECPPPPPPLPRLVGQTATATAYELPDDRVLLHLHANAEASVVLGVGWIAADGASLVPVSFVRDADLGQTYAVVRREADGLIVRRWIAPDDPLVYAIPWDDVNSRNTFPTAVLSTMPLDDRYPWPNQLARRFDGIDDRVFTYDADLGQWWHVPDLATFQALGFSWDNVTAADAGFLTRVAMRPAHPFPRFIR